MKVFGNKSTTAESRDWDYIIVGAGAAGCVLANRLTADPSIQVLLIEAGPSDGGILLGNLVRMPKGFGKILFNPKFTYSYETEPQGINARRFIWKRGRLIGGSTSLNGMIYVRGQVQDYEEWEDLGCTGWGPEEFRRSFDALESSDVGGMPVCVSDKCTPLTEAIFEAAGKHGLRRLRTSEWLEEDEGISCTPSNIKDGRRVSAADAFLRPVQRRANLTVVTDTCIEKIDFESNRAVGVSGRRRGSGRVTYRTRGEVIVCGGALESPRLLQLSGIGDAEMLGGMGIPIVYDSAAVGRNMRDHKPMRLQYRLRRPWSDNRQYAGWRLWRNALHYQLSSGGPLSKTYEMNGFARSTQVLDRTDFQFTVSAYSIVPSGGPLDFEKKHGISVFFYPLRSTSVGFVKIVSPDPDCPLVIEPNYMSTEYDRRTMIGALRHLRDLFKCEPLSGLVAEEIDPGPSVLTDGDILAACEGHPPAAHTTGTCSMGPDGRSVVDLDLKVRGVCGLRIVDASVMPTLISGNTMAPTLAVAWMAAERILLERRKTPGCMNR